MISILNYWMHWCTHMLSIKIITFCACTLCRWKASYRVNLKPLDSSSIDGPVVQPISSGKWLWRSFGIRYFSNLLISSWQTHTCPHLFVSRATTVLFFIHHCTIRDKRVIWCEADVYYFCWLVIHWRWFFFFFWCFLSWKFKVTNSISFLFSLFFLLCLTRKHIFDAEVDQLMS